MAAIDWPTDLPRRVDMSGSSTKLGAGVVKSEIEQRPTFRRQRSAATPDRCSATMTLDDEHVAMLETFFCTTTRFGALRFNWEDQAGVVAEVRFVTPPGWASPQDDVNRVSFEYEILR